ncbi:hypothetical protein BL250_16680 [Erwinia sp. OLTSP20]|uniref:hypothetical protein n=1 Tax=unclassified Erwinia TaxID=2622719 RepID=UPI000C18B9C8|nr:MULTISPECIES: hypothetical protein [unclassified Erwinia]PIJ48971.1 hypothetical protein BV501_14755 [Erwinia sp. OAMSP11]PIJ74624.1 hypothetical protein BK416_03960 [Erwinia sp. OLSSP12]PIJ79655.1 hypothetical protein BLD47_13380 [Erwinia sp. OLCASP19]PIJ80440.1 hypothetical protein BLD46_15225 [Erwinia sp. OLMTSP26]PIJ82555.1 hypothetical protein BLD49_15120 [Erwinia sp. OLMDSP33]
MKDLTKKIIPAYPFVQYRDDKNIVAFFESYNEIAQEYLDYLNNLKLPCWTSSLIIGELLDWIAMGIYGEERPLLQVSEDAIARGAYNTIEYNVIAYARMKNYIPGSASYVPDDYFKRILTWNFYKGDGTHFCIDWLKRRVARFIHGVNGVDPCLQSTYDVSVTVDAGMFSIAIPDYGDGVGHFLKDAIDQSLVKLPFIYEYSTTVVVK